MIYVSLEYYDGIKNCVEITDLLMLLMEMNVVDKEIQDSHNHLQSYGINTEKEYGETNYKIL